MNIQFEKRQAFKTYHALVIGNPSWEEKNVDLPLHPDGDLRHRTVIDAYRGKPSVTHFRVMERFNRSHSLRRSPKLDAHIKFVFTWRG